jgi:DNA polymerase III alpha subunit
LKAHPVAFLRGALDRAGIVEAGRLPEAKDGMRLSVAGLVLVRQRPGTAQGVIFATLEDETGVANLIVWPKVFERYRPIVLGARLLKATGRLQSEQGVIHLVAERLQDLSPLLARLSEDPIGANGLARADEVQRPVEEQRQKVKPKSRATRVLASDPEIALDLPAVKQAPASAMPKGRNFR